MAGQMSYNEELEHEYRERFSTFENWESKVVSKYSLAKLGFKYIGIGDKVQCQYCSGKLRNWEIGDDPYTEHKKHFPGCPLILQLVQDNQKPIEPKYKDLKTRIKTFQLHTFSRTPNELATAGLFYIGSADRTRCFHCGLTLWDWGKDDDPSELHRVFSPACAFIRNRSDFHRLGIQVCEGLEADERLANSPRKQDLIDISQDSPLFQQLLLLYDQATIVREMIVMIRRHGRNFETLEEFVTLVTERHEQLSKNAKMDKDQNELVTENKRLRADQLCRKCGEHNKSILFLPCGHLVSCEKCAETVRDCFICHKTIKGKVTVYRA